MLADTDFPKTESERQLEAEFLRVPEKDRKRWLDKRIRSLNRSLAPKRAAYDRAKAMLNDTGNAYEKLDDWAKGGFVLQRPGGSVSHHLRQEILENRVHDLVDMLTFDADVVKESNFTWEKPKKFDYESEIFSRANYFIVEHDWSAAFKGAQEFADGEFRLPYEVCVFEFRVSGKSVVAPAFDTDGTVQFSPIARRAI